MIPGPGVSHLHHSILSEFSPISLAYHFCWAELTFLMMTVARKGLCLWSQSFTFAPAQQTQKTPLVTGPDLGRREPASCQANSSMVTHTEVLLLEPVVTSEGSLLNQLRDAGPISDWLGTGWYLLDLLRFNEKKKKNFSWVKCYPHKITKWLISIAIKNKQTKNPR